MTKGTLGPILVLFFSFLCLGLCFEHKRSPLKALQDRAEFVCPPGAEGFFCAEACTQFYYYCTAAGGQYLLECPSGTVFDPYQPGQPACVSPGDAVCEDPSATTTTIESTTADSTITTTESPSTTDESTTHETTKTTGATESTSPLSTTTRTPDTCGNYSTTSSFTCPEDSGQYPYDDCSSLYWQCSNGMAYLNCCPANLVYNPDLGVCDYFYAVVGCNSINILQPEVKNQPENKSKIMELKQREHSFKNN